MRQVIARDDLWLKTLNSNLPFIGHHVCLSCLSHVFLVLLVLSFFVFHPRWERREGNVETETETGQTRDTDMIRTRERYREGKGDRYTKLTKGKR